MEKYASKPFNVFENPRNLPPVAEADGLRKTVTVLFFFDGGRHTTTATYCNIRVLSQSGMAPWLELNWIFVINTVSSRLTTIRARLTEKKTSAGDNGGGHALFGSGFPQLSQVFL